MTNNMIILMEVEDKDGNKQQVEIPEEIHTYAEWKQMGYQVQKGQKAITQVVIWKHTTHENEDGEDESKMFMKKASFFKQSQVEKIERDDIVER